MSSIFDGLAVAEFVDHYHHERNHQGLGNELIDREPAAGRLIAFGGINVSVAYSTSTRELREPRVLVSAQLRD